MASMRIALCADGGPAGLGHLGRCAALGQAFKALGHPAVFVDAPAPCRPWLSALGFQTAPLGRTHFDVIIGDSYRFTPAHLARLRRQARTLLLIDDLGTMKAACDFILNANLDAAALRYAAPPAAGRLLGPKFLPLRSEYWRAPRPRRASPVMRRLLISLGAAGASELAARAARAAAKALPRAQITAIIGPFDAMPAPVEGVRFLRGVKSLKPLLESSDAAVLAGGQTIYEAAFTGTPMILFTRAANQSSQAASMISSGAALGLGSAPTAFERRLGPALRALTARRRALMSRSGSGLVDGRGARRVAALLTGGRK